MQTEKNMPRIRAIVVDDEEGGRNFLKNMLTTFCPQVEIVTMADGIQSGLEAIKAHQPDLVFLDIQMPGGTSFQLLEQLEKINFSIIFTTAYDDYAIKAFRFSAIDYLLKPVQPELLVQAVQKVAESHYELQLNQKLQTFIENSQTSKVQDKKVVLHSASGFQIASLNTIVRCRAEGNYTRVFFNDGSKFLACKYLKEFEEMLGKDDFFRSHQSHLVNLNYVKGYQRSRGGEIELQDGSTVDLARSKKQEFLRLFEE